MQQPAALRGAPPDAPPDDDEGGFGEISVLLDAACAAAEAAVAAVDHLQACPRTAAHTDCRASLLPSSPFPT